MLEHRRLQLAIDIQSRSYRLLRWIGGAIGQGLIPPSRAKHHSTDAEAAIDWVSSNYSLFPFDMQPDPSHIREFGAFFWTYLESSFDIIERPGVLHQADRSGCMCPLCAKINSALHLQPKKLTAADRTRANELIINRVSMLAAEAGIESMADRYREISESPTTRRPAALSTYGFWLIKRLSGESDGPSILVLWREIAWKKEGSPIPGFRLHATDIHEAEQLVLSSIRDTA